MEVVKVVALAMIRTYKKVVSPMLPPACRFYPTCSDYTYEAITKHGPWYGMALGLRRLLRCHPFCPGGYDPVPEKGFSLRNPAKTKSL